MYKADGKDFYFEVKLDFWYQLSIHTQRKTPLSLSLQLISYYVDQIHNTFKTK